MEANLAYLQNQKKAPKQGHITVATLNYCDIMNNPFEFYCQEYEKELQELSNIFVQLIPSYLPDFNKEKFKWPLGKIDQKIRVGRYSPAFAPYVGVKNDGFMSKEQFQAKWEEQFQKIPEAKEVPFSQQQKNTTRLYDFILFHALLSYAYADKDFNKLIENPPDKYMDLYRPFYELSFLSEERKLQKFMSSFSAIEADVFFLQEYAQILKAEIQKTNKYHIATDEEKDKLVIVKKTTFPTKKSVNEVFTAEELKQLAWSEDPSIVVADNYIIINSHLSSKADKNKKQLQFMKNHLLELKKKYANYHFIVGGDINSFLGPDGVFEKQFNFYPQKEDQLTTVKKRTMTQGQYHKGNKIVAESKDKVISTLPLHDGSIRYITNEQVQGKALIPTDRHPFDHYVLVAYLQKP